MRAFHWLVMMSLFASTTLWAGLMPFRLAEGLAVPVKEDSVTLYEVVVHSDTTGNLVWNFRLEASPVETIILWVGLPGAGTIYFQGNEAIVPASLTANAMLPKAAKKVPLTLYQIEFPGDKITLISLRTTTPSPWKQTGGEQAGENESWTASVTLSDLSSWAGVVDHVEVAIDLPPRLKEIWQSDPGKLELAATPPYSDVRDGAIWWEYRSWEPDKDISVQTSAYRPIDKEFDLLDSPAFMLPAEYLGDKVAYGDSVLNGYLWMPQFKQLSSSAERGVFAMTYLWIRQSEILARHGFEFTGEPELLSYFEKQSWYHANPRFKAEMLSKIEMQNYWKLINRRSELQPQYRQESRQDTR